MGKIKMLDEATRLKIAAGEVVQNPASVVKELVENAIDAKSSKIIINIQKGGKQLIEIIDNGDGIVSDDVKLAFERYTTSKISSISDLQKLHTLGFRGEALASIAAVSEVELITKDRSASIGTQIHLKGGTILSVDQASHAQGTTVRVRNLFYNVPARLKFLKRSQAEFQAILEIITNYSLLYTSIHFILTHNGVEILNSAAVSDRLDKIYFVYGKDIAKQMILISYSTEILKISGYISRPMIQRGTRKSYSFFVNNRYIKSKLLTEAVDEAYKTVLPRNRHPIIVLTLYIDSQMIDVNIHPAKEEIKFSQEQFIFDTVKTVILDSFSAENIIPKIQLKKKSKPSPHKPPLSPSSREKPSLQPPSVQQPLTSLIGSVSPPPATSLPEPSTPSKLPSFEIIGQSHTLFIIAADADNLYLIDQHAAHERIMFEKFLQELENGIIQMQTLLSPILIEFPLQSALKLESKITLLKEFGFEIEPFGKYTYHITRLPVILGKSLKKDEIQLVIDELLEKIDLESKTLPSRLEIAQLYACKAAIKAGAKLTLSQMQKLCDELRKTKHPFVCAHNRPTIITFSKNDLQQKFLR
ncbi:MAG: DNA mismatch repair endonuclease MutL [Candidatus Helarchaeota archaeon]